MSGMSSTELLRAFAAFDANGDGKISRDEFVGLLTRSTSKGPSVLSESDAKELFAEIDLDGNGRVFIDEFAAAWADKSELLAAGASTAALPATIDKEKARELAGDGFDEADFDTLYNHINDL